MRETLESSSLDGKRLEPKRIASTAKLISRMPPQGPFSSSRKIEPYEKATVKGTATVALLLRQDRASSNKTPRVSGHCQTLANL